MAHGVTASAPFSGQSPLDRGREQLPPLVVLYFIVLALVLLLTHGHFTTGGLLITTLAFLAYLASPWRAGRKPDRPWLTLETVFCVLWLAFSAALMIRNGLMYPQMNLWFVLLRTALTLNFVCAAATAVLLFSSGKMPRAARILLPAALVLVASCFVLTLKASPAPHIDVFTICSKAVDLLRAGHNPYDFLYADIYGGKYTYHPRLMYWPVVTYMITLGKLLAGDVRFGYVLAQFAAAAGLCLLGRRRGWSLEKTFLAVLVWFTFPVSFFVLEQSWVEGLLMPALVFFVYFTERRQWAAAAVMAGLACATKQYMIFFAVFSFVYVWRKAGRGKAFGYAGIASLTTMATMVPFLVWNWRVLLDRTVFEILRYDIRTESLSWIAFSINRLRVPFNASLSLALTVLLSVPALAVILRRGEVRPADLMFTQASVFSAVFLFGNQALCNYYYFLSFLVFLHLVLVDGTGSEA